MIMAWDQILHGAWTRHYNSYGHRRVTVIFQFVWVGLYNIYGHVVLTLTRIGESEGAQNYSVLVNVRYID
jgi:hypothetical protein